MACLSYLYLSYVVGMTVEGAEGRALFCPMASSLDCSPNQEGNLKE